MENDRLSAGKISRPQVKICGITSITDALACANLGADAVGCVFYPKSPRHLDDNQAKEISLAVAEKIQTVGVFANETFSRIMQRVEHCRLSAVQLHGQESPELISRLHNEKVVVIKALFADGQPSFKDISSYHASAFLLECGQGKLPGGNALKWDWGLAKDIGNRYSLIIAGGLAPDNVSYAIGVSRPHAVDVSSGVESSPGRKDRDKVADFMAEVSRYKLKYDFNKIF
ncbi:MAG: phosphoribosylanthranilate isomerase [Desulfobacterales bacterium]|nr:MAG: phosphoribosylanthranilate isomerase [Desulfobacterales bacterium]